MTSKSDTEHALRPPSSMKGFEVCPSFLPSEGSTKASERGVKLHALLEAHLHGSVTKEARAKFEELGLTERDLEDLARIETHLEPVIAKYTKAKLRVLREHKFNLRALRIPGCDKGTGDLLLLNKPECMILLYDYKMGWWEVDEAEKNIQLIIYVLGCFGEFPWCEDVVAEILQPGRDEVSTFKFNRVEHYGPLLLRARTIATRAEKQGGKVFNPTENCLWCGRLGECEAIHDFALRVHKLARLEVPKVKSLNPAGLNDITHAGTVYDLAQVLIKWAKAVKQRATDWATEGHDVPDHGLQEVAGKRTIIDPQGAYETLRAKKFKVSLAEWFSISNPSITQLLKLISSKAPQGSKGTREQEALSALVGEGCVTQNKPSAYLVRISSKANTKQNAKVSV